MQDQTILEIRNLSYQIIKKQVLSDISFCIKKGKLIFLLGRNGAGKTTLFSLITGLYHSQQKEATVMIFGQDVRKAQKSFSDIGIVFQQRTLDLDLTVEQNLLYFAWLQGMDNKTAKKRIEQEVAAFHLIDKLKTKIRELSGGQIRRIELARSLLNSPKLLLLDEPTAGIDLESRATLMQRVSDLCRQGMAVLWTTHLMDEIANTAHIVLLEAGKITAEGTAQALITQTNSNNMQQAFIKLTGIAGNAEALF